MRWEEALASVDLRLERWVPMRAHWGALDWELRGSALIPRQGARWPAPAFHRVLIPRRAECRQD